MALVDMKSNLAAGAGKPLGSPEGRHNPNPDLKTSRLDDGSGIPSGAPAGRHDDSDFKKALTNPGGRHLVGPVTVSAIVPDTKLSKVQKAIAGLYIAGPLFDSRTVIVCRQYGSS